MDPIEKAKAKFTRDRDTDDDSPSLVEAIRAWWVSRSGDSDAENRGVAEAASEMLPDALGGNLRKKMRRRKAAIDDAVRD